MGGWVHYLDNRVAQALYVSHGRMFPEEKRRRWDELSRYEQQGWKDEANVFVNDLSALKVTVESKEHKNAQWISNISTGNH